MFSGLFKGSGDKLLDAADAGELSKVQKLVERGTSANTVDEFNHSVLARASKKGHIDIVKYLVSKNAEVDHANNDGMTPLMYAAEAGNENVVKLLMQAGADRTAKNKDGKTAADLAKSAEVKAILTMVTAEQLVAAIRKKDANVLTMVTKMSKQEMDRRGTDGRTPLFHAAKEGRLDVVTLLVETGADLNSVDKNSTSVLMEAAWRGALDVVKYLYSKGVDIHQRNVWGRNAIYSCGRSEVVTFLLDQGADMQGIDNDGMTAMMDACNWDHFETVEVLLKRGGKINDVDYSGRTPLMHACCNVYQNTNTVELLLEWGASANEVNAKDGWTPLMYAAEKNRMNVIKVLLNAGADRTARNNAGQLAADLTENIATKALLTSHVIRPSKFHPSQRKSAAPTPAPTPAPAPASASAPAPAPAPLPAAVPASAEKAAATMCVPVSPPQPPSPPVVVVEGEDPSMYDPVLPTDPLIARQAELEGKCAAIAVQVAGLPAFLSWLQRRDAAQAALTPLLRGTDYCAIAAHGVALTAIEQEAAKLVLSQADCATLVQRHHQAVAEVVELCKELRAAKQFPALIALGTKLEELKAMDLRGIPADLGTAPLSVTSSSAFAPIPPPLAPLQAKQNTVIGQAQLAATTRAWVQRRDQVKERLRAADEAADPDFVLIGKLSLELDAVEQEGGALLLSEEDYKTLATRHAAVVAETESMCAALVQARAYVELQQQAERLAALGGVEIAPLLAKS